MFIKNQKLTTNANLLFWLILGIVFFILFAPNLLREGMFVDGVWYAAISNNLSNGIGTFWATSFTETNSKDFFGHPPLVFGIQSLFFDVFGSSFWTERIYCFVVFILTCLLIAKIWRISFNSNSDYQRFMYLPLLLWMINFQTFFAYVNNVLETTLTLFILGATYLLLRALKPEEKKATLYAFLSGFLIFLGFMSKGFVALFPFAIPFFYFLIYKIKVQDFIIKTLIILTTFLGSLFLILSIEEAHNFFIKYIDGQLIKSLLGENTENLRNSRFYIMGALLKGLPVALAIALLTLIASYYKNSRKCILKKTTNKSALFYLCIGISGSLPIVLSMKQAGYYLTTTLPFFSIALALLIVPSFKFVIEKLENKANVLQKSFRVVYILLGFSALLAFKNINTIDKRDKVKIEFIKSTTPLIPANSIVSLRTKKPDNSLYGLYQRYRFVALDTISTNYNDFLIIEKDIDTITLNNYRLVDQVENLKYSLYSKN